VFFFHVLVLHRIQVPNYHTIKPGLVMGLKIQPVRQIVDTLL